MGLSSSVGPAVCRDGRAAADMEQCGMEEKVRSTVWPFADGVETLQDGSHLYSTQHETAKTYILANLPF